MAQPNQHTQHVHPGDLPYATPVLRTASPSGSINTEYGPDETSISDQDLSPEEFDRKVQKQLGLHEQREQEFRAQASPLLWPKPRGPQEEKCAYTFSFLRSLIVLLLTPFWNLLRCSIV